MRAQLGNLKIKTKVFASFGIVLALCGVASITSMIGFRITDRTMDDFVFHSLLNDKAAAAQLDVQMLRGAASVYTLTANTDALRRVRDSLGSLKTQLDAMIAMAPKQVYLPMINHAVDDLAQYRAGTEKLVEIKATAAAIQGGILDPTSVEMHNLASGFTARSLADGDF